MFKVTLESEDIYRVEISAPRSPLDEDDFFNFFNQVFEKDRFGILLKVDGDKNFSPSAKKYLGYWFKSNRSRLKAKCFAFVRLKNFVDNDKLIKMNKAMPCPYFEFTMESDAISTLKDQSKILL